MFIGLLLAPLADLQRAAADGEAGISIADVFTPTLLPPGFPVGTPYASTLGLAADPASHSLITLDSGSPAYVAAYDNRTLRPRAGSGRFLDGAITAVLSDPRMPGVVVAVAAAAHQPPTAIEHLEVVGGHVVVARRIGVSGNFGQGQSIVGLAFDPVTTWLFVLTVQYATAPGGGAPTPVPGTVDLALVDTGNATVLWTQALPNCNLPIVSNFVAPPVGPGAPLGVVQQPHVVDVGCGAQSAIVSVSSLKIPIPAGVGIVALSGSGAKTTYGGFALDPFAGDATSSPDGLWVPGVERMAFQVVNNAHGGGWVYFDGRHSDYVGIVPLLQAALEAGIDPVHNRLYLLDEVATTGLATSDVAVTPADQGHAFPEFAGDPIDEDNDHGHTPQPGLLTADPSTGDLFLHYNGSHAYVVAHDNQPYYVTPPAADVDAATQGIPEVLGKTGANYSGSAQGYGSVIRQVGGEASLEYNYVPFDSNGLLLEGTRQLATSYLDQLKLTNAAAVATLVTAVPDQGNTQGQLDQSGQTWPYTPAACADFGSGPKPESGDGGSATCDATGASVSGSIEGGSSSDAVPASVWKSIWQCQPPPPLPSPSGCPLPPAPQQPQPPDVVSINHTKLTTSSTAKFGTGMTTTADASASGISILGGVLRIGEVSVQSTAVANGEAGGAKSTYHRTVQKVFLNGTELCTTSCNEEAIAAQVNAELVGHVRITFPEPDPTMWPQGSPGGYQSLIRRDPYGQAEETTLDDQPATRGEVPGMEITIYEDNSQSSRTIVYLAGTEAEAHYGVYALGGGGCEACPPPTPQPTPSVVVGGSGGSTGSITSTGPGGGQRPVLAGGANLGAFFKHGWQLLVAGLGDALRQFGVWLILLLPVYLSARRWALANRHDRTAGSA